jgi:hypothetical protein
LALPKFRKRESQDGHTCRGQFSLQSYDRFGTFALVRIVFVLGIWFTATAVALAQKQEPGLIDRLLKPNTALANSDQNKKFTNLRATTLEKTADTRSFYAPSRTVTKDFQGERAFTSRQFAARHFRAGDSSAYLATRSQLIKTDTLIATPAATAGTRVAPESGQAAPVREYAGNRPFLDKGKSQKSLSVQNRPLTIEQVRELLNKSK